MFRLVFGDLLVIPLWCSHSNVIRHELFLCFIKLFLSESARKESQFRDQNQLLRLDLKQPTFFGGD